MLDIERFDLMEDDEYAIDVAISVARRFLKQSNIKPKQVVGIGNALYALERMPNITDGVCCKFGLIYTKGNEEYSEMRYIDFRITDNDFEISEGGSVYDKSVGNDSYSYHGWYIEASGFKDTGADLYNIEDSIVEYLNLGAEITVNDESDIVVGANKLNYKDKIISDMAKSTCKKISRKVVLRLQKMTEGMQSGDDTPLKNVWDEVCVQVQYEQSVMWDAYLDVIRSLIRHETKLLNTEILQAIWLQTEEGMSWEDDLQGQDEVGHEIDFSEDDIVEFIMQEYILSTAADWSNKRIEKYIEDGYDLG